MTWQYMKHRRILVLAFSLFSVLSFFFPVNAAVVWNVSLWGTSRAVTISIEHLANELDIRTNGDLKLVLHFGESISPARENIDGVAFGAFEAAHICPSYHPGKTPAMLALELPFLPFSNLRTAHEVAKRVNQHPVIVSELDRFRVKILQHVIAPRYEFMGRGAPPTHLADWKGMRVRAPGAIGSGVRELGGRPTSVSAPEIYTSLDRGLFDAAALPFSYTFASYRIYEVADWYTFNMNLAVPNCVVVVNQDAWSSLSPKYKTLINTINVEAYNLQLEALLHTDAEWIPQFDASGLTRITYDQVSLDAFKKRASDKIWRDWVLKNKNRFEAQDYLDFILQQIALLSADRE